MPDEWDARSLRFLIALVGVLAACLSSFGVARMESVWASFEVTTTAVFCWAPLAILILAGSLVFVGVRWFRRQLCWWDLLPTLLIVTGVVVGWYVEGETRLGTAEPFYRHREQFVETAETLLRECDRPWCCTGHTAFYRDACLYKDRLGVTEIEFIVYETKDWHYPLLLYVPTVSGESEENPCSRVTYRYLREKIDDHWYVCWQSTD
jgi:hypothetical protein